MIKQSLFFLNVTLFLISSGCYHADSQAPLVAIQIQDRNGMTETFSNPERLAVYESKDFLTSQPYKKVLRVYKKDGKNQSIITTYHPNGAVFRYLEAQEMRAKGRYQEWFSNGQLKIEATVISGTADLSPGAQEDWLFDGLSQVWDEQGNLVAQIPYDKGFLEGESIYYFPSGTIQKKVPFSKNAQEGMSIEYFPGGSIQSKAHYKKGVKNGISQGFFESGQISWDETHNDGYLEKGSYFNPKGELISQVENGAGFQASFVDNALTLVEFRCGKPEGLVKKYTSQGELKNSFQIKKGMKHGEELEYYLKNEIDEASNLFAQSPKLSVNWIENGIHGTTKTWYSNGKLQSQRNFSKNRKLGPSLAWYRDGTLMMMEEYEDDLLIKGQYFTRYQKEPISSVINGNGLASLYDENGIFLKKITYVKGKPIDPEK